MFCGPVLSLESGAFPAYNRKTPVVPGCFEMSLRTLRLYLDKGQRNIARGKNLPKTCTVHARVLVNVNSADLEPEESDEEKN